MRSLLPATLIATVILLVPGCGGASQLAVGVGIGIGILGLVIVLIVGLAMYLYREIAALRERVAKTEVRRDARGDPE